MKTSEKQNKTHIKHSQWLWDMNSFVGREEKSIKSSYTWLWMSSCWHQHGDALLPGVTPWPSRQGDHRRSKKGQPLSTRLPIDHFRKHQQGHRRTFLCLRSGGCSEGTEIYVFYWAFGVCVCIFMVSAYLCVCICMSGCVCRIVA